MVKSLLPRRRALPHPHPGKLIREEVLPGLGLSVAQAARRLGLAPAALDGILQERRAVTPAIARQLGDLAGNGPDIWLALQRAWDGRHTG